MLTGILFQFGIDVFNSMEHRLLLVGCMSITYLLMKKMQPHYAIVIVLAVGLVICQLQGLLNFDDFKFVAVKPQFIIPAFSLHTLISIGISLFVVTMVSQNIPGIAVLRSAGYQTPLSPLISWTGLATLRHSVLFLLFVTLPKRRCRCRLIARISNRVCINTGRISANRNHCFQPKHRCKRG
jgi:benzoate membrane transport protein